MTNTKQTEFFAQLANIKQVVQSNPLPKAPTMPSRLVLNRDKPISDYLTFKQAE